MVKTYNLPGEPFHCDAGDQLIMVPTRSSRATNLCVYIVANNSKQNNRVIIFQCCHRISDKLGYDLCTTPFEKCIKNTQQRYSYSDRISDKLGYNLCTT